MPVIFLAAALCAQDAKPQPKADAPPAPAKDATAGYSGMYTFLKDGEFVQLTVEDGNRVSGFISNYVQGESGEFVDQFFKTAKLEGNKLSFTTNENKGVSFDFKGSAERGEGKNPGDESYYVLKGTLTETTTGADKKVNSYTQEVTFKAFSHDAVPPAATNN